MIGMVTSDMPAALAFYRRLGLDIPAEADREPHVEAAGPGGMRIGWDTVEVLQSFQPGWEPPPRGQGLIGLAFLCAAPADVDTLYAELTAAGYHGAKAPWDADWGQRYALISDPDGNEVSLFARLG